MASNDDDGGLGCILFFVFAALLIWEVWAINDTHERVKCIEDTIQRMVSHG